MVFLTAQHWLRSRVTDRYWRVQEVLKHARVSWPRTPRGAPRAPAGPADRPPFPFFDPAFPGKEEPLLPAGRPGCDKSVCEVHESSETEEEELEDGELGPGGPGVAAREPSHRGLRGWPAALLSRRGFRRI